MCGLVMDAMVLMILVQTLNDEDPPGWGISIVSALAIGLGFALVGAAVSPFGLIVLLLALIPMAGVAGVVLWLLLEVPPKKAMLGGAIFLVYRIVFAIVWTTMFTVEAA